MHDDAGERQHDEAERRELHRHLLVAGDRRRRGGAEHRGRDAAAATPVFLRAEVSLVICDATTAPPTVYAAVTGATAVAAGRSYMPGTLIFDAGTRSAAVGRKMIEKTRTSWAKPAAVARTFILTCGGAGGGCGRPKSARNQYGS